MVCRARTVDDGGDGGDSFYYALHGAAQESGRLQQLCSLLQSSTADEPRRAFTQAMRTTVAAWITSNPQSRIVANTIRATALASEVGRDGAPVDDTIAHVVTRVVNLLLRRRLRVRVITRLAAHYKIPDDDTLVLLRSGDTYRHVHMVHSCDSSRSMRTQDAAGRAWDRALGLTDAANAIDAYTHAGCAS